MSCKHVLIVEDDQYIKEMMQDILEVQGYKISTASDGREGIRKLESSSPLPGVVLLDMMMPGQNGWEFLDFQRNNPVFSQIPVIVCSAYIEIAKSVRAQGVIDKPIKLEALLNAVQELCA